jgi:hypothetical protein
MNVGARDEGDCCIGEPEIGSALETARVIYETPARASHRVRCSKTNCGSAGGAGHGPDWFLHWREGGIHRRCYVRRADLLEVRAVIKRRRPGIPDVGVTPP